MARFTRTATALVGIAATVLTVAVVPHATAGTLADAQARAAALARTVDRLRTQEEVATERYDQIQSELNDAVSQRTLADEDLTKMQASAAQAQADLRSQAQALYETGGDASVVAALLVGEDPDTALNSYRLADSVLAAQNRSARAAAATVSTATLLDARDAAISSRITRLQVASQADASRVTMLLASQKKALANANSTVRRIMRAQEAAAAAAQAADFSDALVAAGGTLDPGGSVTPPNNIAAMAIAAARSRLGVPYVWGATGPDSFDCSGLTQWSYAHAGIALPRTAAEQWTAGPHPTLSQLEPGDLLFWALNTSDPATIHHVAMYIGNGLMIAAPHTGENVQIQPVYLDGFIGAMRPWGPVS